MKKLLLLALTVILMSTLILVGCAEPEEAAPAPAPTPTPAPAEPSPDEDKYGGVMRIITTGSPYNIGYAAKQGFPDHTPGTLWSNRIFILDTNGDMQPSLALSYDVSGDGKVITIDLREGVKFQDGTDWNAEACAWTFRTGLEHGALAGGKYIDSVDVIDDYTVQVTLNQRNNQVIYDLTRLYQYSPTAFEINGEEWAINNSVSTQAFQVTEFQPDVGVTMVRFDDYWRPDYPYLDGVELIVVKEAATCSAMIQAGQADIWMGAAAQEAADLRDKGYQVLSAPTLINNIYFDSANPESPWADKKMREAVEYALDRPAMAAALGFGFQDPINQLAPPGTAGYNPDYVGRPYNPDKARELLAEAGHPDGINVTMMLMSTALNTGTVIQNYLAEIGITVELDVADAGRYWGSIFGSGWEGLLLGVSAINPEYAVAWLHHFGPEPLVKFVSLGKSPEYLAICEELVRAPDIATMRALTMKMVTQASEDVMAVPMTVTIGTSIAQNNVHTGYYTDADWTYWLMYHDWLEK